MGPTIIVALIIGAIAAGIATLVLNRYLKNTNKIIKSIIILLITLSVTFIGNKYIVKPIQIKYKIKKDFEKLKKTNPLIAIIEKWDSNAIEKLSNIYAQGLRQGKTKHELTQLAYAFGAKISGKYLQKASDELIINHTKALMNLIITISIQSYYAAANMIFPGVFIDTTGNFNDLKLKLFTKEGSGKQLISVLEKIIAYTKKNKNNHPIDSAALTGFQKMYFAKYPKRAFVLHNLKSMKIQKKEKIVIQTVIHFYSQIIKLPKNKAGGILRAIHNN